MTDKEIIKHIDNGANFYIRLFGDAEHMEIVDCNYYRYVKPKTDVHGISFIFDICLDDLPFEKTKSIVSEIKNLNMPYWLNLSSSDDLFYLFFGKYRMHGQTTFSENDEIYMALFPTDNAIAPSTSYMMKEVQTAEEFALWANICNSILSNGLPDVHPHFHFPLCQRGLMKCFMVYKNDKPVSVSAILNNHGIASLEFVATSPDMRRKGCAKAVCEKAIQNAFNDGAKLITVRAINQAASKLYESLGFKAYNYAI